MEDTVENLHKEATLHVTDLLRNPNDQDAREFLSEINNRIGVADKKIDIDAIANIVSSRTELLNQLRLDPTNVDGLKAVQDINADLQQLTTNKGYPAWQFPTSVQPDGTIREIYESLTPDLELVAKTGGTQEVISRLASKDAQIFTHAKETMKLEESDAASLKVKVDEYCSLAKPGYEIMSKEIWPENIGELKAVQAKLAVFLAANSYPPTWGFAQVIGESPADSTSKSRAAKEIHWPWSTVQAKNGDTVLCEIYYTKWNSKEDREDVNRKFIVEFQEGDYFQREITKLDQETIEKWDSAGDTKVIKAGSETKYGAKHRKSFDKLHWIAYAPPSIRDKSKASSRAASTRCFISFKDGTWDLVTLTALRAIRTADVAMKDIKEVCLRDGMATPWKAEPRRFVEDNPKAPKRRYEMNPSEKSGDKDTGVSPSHRATESLDGMSVAEHKDKIAMELEERIASKIEAKFDAKFDELKEMMMKMMKN